MSQRSTVFEFYIIGCWKLRSSHPHPLRFWPGELKTWRLIPGMENLHLQRFWDENWWTNTAAENFNDFWLQRCFSRNVLRSERFPHHELLIEVQCSYSWEGEVRTSWTPRRESANQIVWVGLGVLILVLILMVIHCWVVNYRNLYQVTRYSIIGMYYRYTIWTYICSNYSWFFHVTSIHIEITDSTQRWEIRIASESMVP